MFSLWFSGPGIVQRVHHQWHPHLLWPYPRADVDGNPGAHEFPHWLPGSTSEAEFGSKSEVNPHAGGRQHEYGVWGGTLHCGTRLFVETLRVSCRSALNNIAVHLPMRYQCYGTVAHWKKNQQWNTLTGFTDVRFRRGFHCIPPSVHFHSLQLHLDFTPE